MNSTVRTRFAPSPTGYMHIGNLRTALYEYLIAKSQNGKFILRIEDTDQSRFVEGAEEIIYRTLKKVGLNHDEGPDIGGNYGPYKQSERKNNYLKYAEKLVSEGKAYYCFCEKNEEESQVSGHSDKCRNISYEEAKKMISEGKKYVIRQKMPKEGTTSFEDMVFGKVTVENKELEDQILIKSDGFPTYNFANVIDDYEMKITHVVRGSEYLSSTPKYNLLYQDLGWEIPKYIHLPLIMGKNEDGTTSKLSKRHGAVSFEDLLNLGYLPQAIINYIAFLGWCPESNEEIFSLKKLEKEFSIKRISKSPSIFDYKKLDWFNSEYIKNMSDEEFYSLSVNHIEKSISKDYINKKLISNLLKNRISTFNQIPEMIEFLENIPPYEIDLFKNKKSKSTLESSLEILKIISEKLDSVSSWDYQTIHDTLINTAAESGIKNATLMWPVRIAISGKTITPGGAVEILEILGKNESLNRIKKAIDMLCEK